MTVRLPSAIVLVLGLSIPSAEAGRILALLPTMSPSHHILMSALARGLADAGHDVTLVSPFTEKKPPKYREIMLDGYLEYFEEQMKERQFNLFERAVNPVVLTFFIMHFSHNAVEKALNHTKIQELIQSDEKFDVLIMAQFINDALKALAHHFNAHLVVFSQSPPSSWLNHLVGNPSLPSYHPDVILNLPSKMSFIQRVQNTLYKLFFTIYLHLDFYPKQNALVQKYVPNAVDLNDALYNVSLLLVNSDSSMFPAQPKVPCMVEIGGFHVQPPKKLPEDLQSFLDNATDGVVYFSMGSNLKSKLMPVEKREAILKAFGKRKEKILWKWEDDVLPGQPQNVKLGKWLPQQDILAHPNVKLFITHGGLLSLTETIYHGIPVIAIPIFGDQKVNANNAKEAGYGLILPFPEITEETMSSVLDEILDDPKYLENAKERSRIMHDKQVKPLDNAVYWVEYVIRHNGAKHLKVPYLELTWYQYYLLDVILFIIAVIFTALYVIKKVFSLLYKKFQNKRKVD